MAIITTNIEIGGRKLVKHESDRGVYIRQKETGREYSSAVDTLPCRFTYEETEKVIEEHPGMGG